MQCHVSIPYKFQLIYLSLLALASTLQPQDRMAAVRPLHIPEPPPLISSAKPGGSITQVGAALNLDMPVFL